MTAIGGFGFGGSAALERMFWKDMTLRLDVWGAASLVIGEASCDDSGGGRTVAAAVAGACRLDVVANGLTWATDDGVRRGLSFMYTSFCFVGSRRPGVAAIGGCRFGGLSEPPSGAAGGAWEGASGLRGCWEKEGAMGDEYDALPL